jgi:hypothetical protein
MAGTGELAEWIELKIVRDVAGEADVNNDPKHDLFGYIVFTYTFHLWGGKKDVMPVATRPSG